MNVKYEKSMDARREVVVGEGKVFLLDSETGAIKTTLELGRAARSGFFVPLGLVFSLSGKRLFARGRDAILFWNLK